MAKFEFTSYQIESLKNLFSDMSNEVFEEFIYYLKMYLENGSYKESIKGDDANRKVNIKKQASILREIAKNAQKLKTLMDSLDTPYLESIECEIRMEQFQKVRHHGDISELIDVLKDVHQTIPEKERHISNLYAQYFKEVRKKHYEDNFDALLDVLDETVFEAFVSLKTSDNLDLWIDESIGIAFVLEKELGNGYLESFISAATLNWADYVKLPITYSESSLFIKYLAILLDTTSTEKLSKIAIRSKWLIKYRPAMDFRISNKRGHILSEDEIKHLSKLTKRIYDDDTRWQKLITNEIAQIKNLKTK